MKKYEISLNGQNYLFNFDGELRKVGFHTTRIVKASSQEEAKEKAIALLRRDPTLVQGTLNGVDDPPTIQANTVKRSLISLLKRKSAAFDFYLEDEEAYSKIV